MINIHTTSDIRVGGRPRPTQQPAKSGSILTVQRAVLAAALWGSIAFTPANAHAGWWDYLVGFLSYEADKATNWLIRNEECAVDTALAVSTCAGAVASGGAIPGATCATAGQKAVNSCSK